MNSEVWLRAQYQTVLKERDQLQSQLKRLERDNQDLRKSVYELSYQLSQLTPASLFQVQQMRGESNWKTLRNTAEGSVESRSEGYSVEERRERRDESDGRLEGGEKTRVDVLPVLPTPPVLDFRGSEEKRCVEYEREIKGHSGAVYCADISPDNRFMATGSFDKTIILWDVMFPYKMRGSLVGHAQLVSDLCWALTSSWASGKENDKDDDINAKSNNASSKYLLYSVSYDKTMRIWEAESKTCLSVIKLKGLGTTLCPCMPSPKYPMGFMVATTSTQYFYIVENSTVLLNQSNMEEKGSEVGGGVGTGASSNDNSNAVDNAGAGAGGTGSGAVFYKHSHVATSAVCFIDQVHGCGVFLGDTSGCVSFYKISSDKQHIKKISSTPLISQDVIETSNTGNINETLATPPIPVFSVSTQLLTPVIIGQQSLYTTHFNSSLGKDSNNDFRLLDMKLCGKGQANTIPPFSPLKKPQTTALPGAQTARVQHKDTLLAVQSSDNCIRLYVVCEIGDNFDSDILPPPVHQRNISGGSTSSIHSIHSSKSVYSQGDTNNEIREPEKQSLPHLASDFLRPIRILEGHNTGEWSIKLRILCGNRYSIHFPHSRRTHTHSTSKRINTTGKVGAGHSHLHQSTINKNLLVSDGSSQQHTSKSAYRNIIPVESGGGENTVGGGGGVVTATVSSLEIPSLNDRLHWDRSRSAEASPRGRRSRSESRGSSISDEREFDHMDKDRGSENGMGIEKDEDDLDDEHDSLLDGDEDENDLSMVAGLVSSQLMATDDSLPVDDDEVLDGLAEPTGISDGGRLKTAIERQRHLGAKGGRLGQATQWENSLMLATGCSNGKVFIYDISAIAHSDSMIDDGNNLTSINSGSLVHGQPNLSSTSSSSLVWKVLHAQSSGKSYGVAVNKPNTAIFTFGSESTVKAWTLSNTGDTGDK